MLAKQGGIPLETAYEVIRASSGNSFVHETESQVILNGSYDIGFTMDLAVKDLGFALALGRRLGVPLELAGLVEAHLRARARAVRRLGLVEPGREAARGRAGRRPAGAGLPGAARGNAAGARRRRFGRWPGSARRRPAARASRASPGRPPRAASPPRGRGVRAHARAAVEVVRDHGRLVAVLEVAAAHACELGGRREQHGRRRALLQRLQHHAAGALALRPAGHDRRVHVALEVRHDPARHQRVGRDAVVRPAARRLDGEQHVGRLGLAVREPRVVRAALEVDVLEDDRRAAMGGRAHGDDAAGAVGGQRLAQAEREREVPEVVGRELQLPALGRARLGGRHHAGVVDQHVQRPVQAADEAAIDARSARSRCATCTPELPVVSTISPAVRSPAAMSRTASVTSAPVPASARAVSMPIPTRRP